MRAPGRAGLQSRDPGVKNDYYYRLDAAVDLEVDGIGNGDHIEQNDSLHAQQPCRA